MIQKEQGRKGNKKDKVKDRNRAVCVVFIVCSSEHIATKSL